MSDKNNNKDNALACYRVTILEVLSDGKDGGEFRALVSSRDKSSLFLTAPAALECAAHDDIHLVARCRKSGRDGIPDTLEADIKAQPQKRAEGLLSDEAEIRSFGEIGGAEDRPILTAIAELSTHPLQEIEDKDDYLVIKANRKSDDADLQWAIDYMGKTKVKAPVVVIDPMTMARPVPGPACDRSIFRSYWGPQLKERLHNVIPENFKTFISEDYASNMVFPSANSTYRQADKSRFASRGAVVVFPYQPWQTTVDFWEGKSDLGANQFMPKWVCDQRQMKLRTTLHELAHAVQDDYGMDKEGLDRDELVHLHEHFADSFAVLALYQKEGEAAEPTLRSLAAGRLAELLTKDDFGHANGKSVVMALHRARNLHKSGELAKMSVDDVLYMAAEIAETNAYNKEELEELKIIRDDFYKANDCLDDMEYSSLKSIATDRAFVALEKELENPTGALGKYNKDFRRTLKGIKDFSYLPSELENENILEKAIEIYKDDLKATFESVDHRIDLCRNILRYQEDTLCGSLAISKSPISKKVEALRKEIISSYDVEDSSKDFREVEDEEKRFAKSRPAIMMQSRFSDHGLINAFAASPETRVSKWEELIYQEVSDLKNKKFQAAADTAKERQYYAFAMRSDANHWAKIKAESPDAAKQIEADISNKNKVLSGEKAMKKRITLSRRDDIRFSSKKAPSL